MKCHDCEEPIIESERPAAVPCSLCKKVMHAECRMSDPSTARDYCESCYYSATRQGLAAIATQAEAEA